MNKTKTLKNVQMINILSYNILLSKYSEKIINNCVDFAKDGVMVFCLQEVVKYPKKDFIIDTLLNALGKDWRVTYHLGDEKSSLNSGTCIIWNRRFITLRTSKKILLPKITQLSIHEIILNKLLGFKGIPVHRRAIAGLFEYQGSEIVIASIHLDNVGGTKHRLKQLEYFIENLKEEQQVKYKILCGDFNSYDVLKTGYEKQAFRQTLGEEFEDAAKNVSWTVDLADLDTPERFPYFVMLIKALKIHFRRKLDYIWINNLKIIDCRKVNVSGSDHYPVIAKLKMLDI